MKFIKKLLLSGSLACVLMAPFASSAFAVKLPPEYPSEDEVILDAIVGRPLLIAATAAGTALFIVTLPFTLIAQNTGQAAKTLIANPGNAAFNRCLGCTAGHRINQHIEETDY